MTGCSALVQAGVVLYVAAFDHVVTKVRPIFCTSRDCPAGSAAAGAVRRAVAAVGESAPGARDTILAGNGTVAFQGAGLTLVGATNDTIDVSGIDAVPGGDDDAFDLGGILSAIIGVILVLLIAGLVARRAGGGSTARPV